MLSARARDAAPPMLPWRDFASKPSPLSAVSRMGAVVIDTKGEGVIGAPTGGQSCPLLYACYGHVRHLLSTKEIP